MDLMRRRRIRKRRYCFLVCWTAAIVSCSSCWNRQKPGKTNGILLFDFQTGVNRCDAQGECLSRFMQDSHDTSANLIKIKSKLIITLLSRSLGRVFFWAVLRGRTPKQTKELEHSGYIVKNAHLGVTTSSQIVFARQNWTDDVGSERADTGIKNYQGKAASLRPWSHKAHPFGYLNKVLSQRFANL